VQDLADRVAAWFVPAVIAIALASAAVHWAVSWSREGTVSLADGVFAGVAVLIIACPCALGLATPTVVLVATGIAARRGILVRNARALEAAAAARVAVLDKTGTLTMGKPAVTHVIPASRAEGEDEVLRLAASVEASSEHPLAQAIVQRALELGLSPPPASSFRSRTGEGAHAIVNGMAVFVGRPNAVAAVAGGLPRPLQEAMAPLERDGATVVAVLKEQRAIGLIALADPIRPNSAEVVGSLKHLGIEPVLATGDSEGTAAAVSRSVGIERHFAGVTPEGKKEIVGTLQAQGNKVIFVGDGINDAPALAAADAGIAMGAGTDVAIEAGEIVLLNSDPSKVVETVRLARAALRKARQNLVWALLYNTILIPLAAVGVIHPILASAAMALSSLSVVTNSLMLRRVRLY